MLPLWEATISRPGGSPSSAKAALAVSASGVWVSMSPKLFGPSSRVPRAEAISVS